jgi:5-carboxymethyl-2-hydroxymuconic-semialdehyde dehydrogenase
VAGVGVDTRHWIGGRRIGSAATFTDISPVDERPIAEISRGAGARPLLGGTPNHDLGGLYYRPTLLAGAKPGSEILTEEVFGPVLTLQTFSGEDEAVALANSTRYGLAATMFTGDHDRAERVSARLVAGTVWVNCFFVRDLRAPFGGAGLSGIGREGGTWSFDFYGDVKNTVYAPEGWRSDG